MDTNELRKVLGYLNIGLAIAHSRGVSIGHFGNGDFIELAETVNSIVLHAITPAAAGGAVSGIAGAPVAIGAPVVLGTA